MTTKRWKFGLVILSLLIMNTECLCDLVDCIDIQSKNEPKENEVLVFLRSLGLEEHFPSFQNEELLTLDTLRGITDDELQRLGLETMGQRRKVQNGINDKFHLWNDGKQTERIEEMEKQIKTIENRVVAPLI